MRARQSRRGARPARGARRRRENPGRRAESRAALNFRHAAAGDADRHQPRRRASPVFVQARAGWHRRAVRHHTLETSPLVRARFPVLAEAMTHVAHLAIRNRGTIGGSLSHADPAAELPTMAVLLDAEIHVRSARGQRFIAPAHFFLGPLTPALDDDEIVDRDRAAAAAARHRLGVRGICAAPRRLRHRRGRRDGPARARPDREARLALTRHRRDAGAPARPRSGLAGETPVRRPDRRDRRAGGREPSRPNYRSARPRPTIAAISCGVLTRARARDGRRRAEGAPQ